MRRRKIDAALVEKVGVQHAYVYGYICTLVTEKKTGKSREEIAYDLGLSYDQVRRSLLYLKRADLIEYETDPGRPSRYTPLGWGHL